VLEARFQLQVLRTTAPDSLTTLSALFGGQNLAASFVLALTRRRRAEILLLNLTNTATAEINLRLTLRNR
jgi:hypothetical protein